LDEQSFIAVKDSHHGEKREKDSFKDVDHRSSSPSYQTPEA